MKNKIVQLIPTLSYGDAVSNDAYAMKNVIKSMGIDTEIYAGNRIGRATSLGKTIDDMPGLKRNDVAVLHLSTGDAVNVRFADLSCRKIVVYHNITPPSFFRGYHPFMEAVSHSALKDMKMLCDKADYALADSEFNKKDLVDAGYRCPIDVLPIIIPFDDYKRPPSQEVLNRYADDHENFLFAGRIVPNKKVEDVIAAFYCYQRDYNPNARLFIVGSYRPEDIYFDRLNKYIAKLGVRDVLFTGHITFEEILAYFRLADAYISLSEHEGFCVPLVESMAMNIPIIAFDRCAVPETLGGSGVLLSDKAPRFVAGIMHRLVSDATWRADLLRGQQKQLERFSERRVADQFKRYLQRFIGEVSV